MTVETSGVNLRHVDESSTVGMVKELGNETILKLPGRIVGAITRLNIWDRGHNDLSRAEVHKYLYFFANETIVLEYLDRYKMALLEVFGPGEDQNVHMNMMSLAILGQVSNFLDMKLGMKMYANRALHFLQPDSDPESRLKWDEVMTLRDLINDPDQLRGSPLFSCSGEAKALLKYGAGTHDVDIEDVDTRASLEMLKSDSKNLLLLNLMGDVAYSLEVKEYFAAGGFCLGVANLSIRDGDILVSFDLDPEALYIIRQVGEDLYELVSTAFVPQFHAQEDFLKGETVSFRLC